MPTYRALLEGKQTKLWHRTVDGIHPTWQTKRAIGGIIAGVLRRMVCSDFCHVVLVSSHSLPDVFVRSNDISEIFNSENEIQVQNVKNV